MTHTIANSDDIVEIVTAQKVLKTLRLFDKIVAFLTFHSYS